MDFEYKGKNISLKNKVLSKLDLFVIDFVNILTKYADYVVVSGYVSIIFGRSRGTEDIDILINKIDMETFIKFNRELIGKQYWFLNADNPGELYGMLHDGLAVRIAIKETVIPNIELKFVKSDLDKISLREHMIIETEENSINISPLELQIPFKLFLGSDKDIEDAVYLYDIFSNHLDKVKLKQYMSILKVKGTDYGIDV